MKPKQLLELLKHGADASRMDKSVFWIDPPCRGKDVPLKDCAREGGGSSPTLVYPRDILDLCDYVEQLEANAHQAL